MGWLFAVALGLTAIGIGGTAILNLMKEFVLTKITTNVPQRPNPADPNHP